MTAYLLFDDVNQLRSIGTVLVNPLPVGWHTTALSDADFAALKVGDKIYDPGTQTVIANPKVSDQATQATILAGMSGAMARLQQIIDTPPATFANIAQAQTAFQTLQVAVQDLAKGMRRAARLWTNDYTGTT